MSITHTLNIKVNSSLQLRDTIPPTAVDEHCILAYLLFWFYLMYVYDKQLRHSINFEIEVIPTTQNKYNKSLQKLQKVLLSRKIVLFIML